MPSDKGNVYKTQFQDHKAWKRRIALEQRVSALIIDTEGLGKADHTDS